MLITKNLNRKLLRGSLTVESCIILPLLICLFVTVLYIAKFAYINIVLDQVTSETVKQLAANSYPVAMLNECEDEIIEKYGSSNFNPIEFLSGKEESFSLDYNTVLNEFIVNEKNLSIEKFASKMFELTKQGIASMIINSISDDYWNIKNNGKNLIAKSIYKKNLNKTNIKSLDTKLVFAELPQSEAEYNSKLNSNYYKKNKTVSHLNISKDDVIICVEHEFTYDLPFTGKKTIKTVHIAVEKAWIHGSNGVISSLEEGLDFFEDKDFYLVYITKTGIRYHAVSCRYLHSSKIPIYKDEAVNKGYTECMVCEP